jgi:hypothetical protein
MFTFDPVINYGTILATLFNTIVVFGSVIGFFWKVKSDISYLKFDLKILHETTKLMQQTLDQLNKVLTQVAVQDTRLLMLERSIDEMKHGQGFIRNRKV